MRIRIRVYPQHHSIGARRARAARHQQQLLRQQRWQLQQQLLRQQLIMQQRMTGYGGAFGGSWTGAAQWSPVGSWGGISHSPYASVPGPVGAAWSGAHGSAWYAGGAPVAGWAPAYPSPFAGALAGGMGLGWFGSGSFG